MDLHLTTLIEGEAAIVAATGEVDVHAAPQLRGELGDLVRAGHHHLVVDLQRVTFMDSSGIGVLIGALKKTRAHDGSLRVVCANDPILKLLRITGLTRVFPIHATIGEALAGIRSDVDRRPAEPTGFAPMELGEWSPTDSPGR